jgi:hypothetical protein
MDEEEMPADFLLGNLKRRDSFICKHRWKSSIKMILRDIQSVHCIVPLSMGDSLYRTPAFGRNVELFDTSRAYGQFNCMGNMNS